ncbi:hypothetical protein RhiirC2_857648 [Rhizophagus irregularis]|uniref:DUF8211 domain-containing protein n=1 Tax=Rhizophagus irregularis TaxID=588596 RepID=A0A2N1MAR1_9GLOM|nr:hypothetical protein RhiirC2_857648 [Rhizophagus irregularis]
MMSHRNSCTKTFFNFSYKRYRFHFGIFTPCNFSSTYNFDTEHTQICRVPSPYIMSHNRRASVSHQKHLEIYQNIKKLTLLSNNNAINNKKFHATRTYYRWQICAKKHIYSNRLGISYDVSYLANGHKYLYTFKNRRMYRKRLDNFLSHHSHSSKRSKKQKSHFQRACRSVFYNRGNKKKSHKHVDTLEEKLHRARQHRFLFLPSQYINKPIQHLKSHKRLVLRDEEYYNFPIPPDTSSTFSPAITSQPILPKNENTWHDKLGIWIPNDLYPYVTDEPVYTSKRQAKIKGRASEVAHLAYEEELSTRAKLWGTSSNRIEYQQNQTRKKCLQSNKQLLQLEQELGHTSDNTKQLELRPNKRPPISPINADRHVAHIKKVRLDTLSLEDFKVFALP